MWMSPRQIVDFLLSHPKIFLECVFFIGLTIYLIIGSYYHFCEIFYENKDDVKPENDLIDDN